MLVCSAVLVVDGADQNEFTYFPNKHFHNHSTGKFKIDWGRVNAIMIDNDGSLFDLLNDDS